MDGKIIMLWLIVECPKCLRPQGLHKHLLDGTIINLERTRYMTCEYCDQGFFVELKESDFAVS